MYRIDDSVLNFYYTNVKLILNATLVYNSLAHYILVVMQTLEDASFTHMHTCYSSSTFMGRGQLQETEASLLQPSPLLTDIHRQ